MDKVKELLNDEIQQLKGLIQKNDIKIGAYKESLESCRSHNKVYTTQIIELERALKKLEK